MNRAFVGFLSFVYRAFCALAHPVRLSGVENLPLEGGAIVCANHASLQDPMLLAAYLPRRVRFMAKRELFDNKLLAPIMRALGAFPVSRGERDLSAVRASLEILKDGGLLGIFPEGHRFSDGEMHALEGGLALIAIRSGAPVIPAYISGGYRAFKRVTLAIGAPVALGDLGARPDGVTIRAATARISEAFRVLSAKSG